VAENMPKFYEEKCRTPRVDFYNRSPVLVEENENGKNQ
jgi:hypothetical protein